MTTSEEGESNGNEEAPESILTPEEQMEVRRGELVPAEPLHELLQLERERIDSNNRRTEVMRLAIEANKESDRQQFDFSMAQLGHESTKTESKHSIAKLVIYVGGSFVLILFAFLIGMAFFGSPYQAQIAFDLVKIILAGVAGYGVITGIVNFLRRMF
jgi:hypothetical protein